MRITKSEEYGMRLIMRLASAGDQLNIRELAEFEGLPEPTVAKVISKLRRAELVRAERGRNGGYSLTQPATDITIRRVVSAFETNVYGPDFCDRMSPGQGSCTNESSCGLRPVWRGLTAVIGDFLDSITVADVIHGTTQQPDSLPMVASPGLERSALSLGGES